MRCVVSQDDEESWLPSTENMTFVGAWPPPTVDASASVPRANVYGWGTVRLIVG